MFGRQLMKNNWYANLYVAYIYYYCLHIFTVQKLIEKRSNFVTNKTIGFTSKNDDKFMIICDDLMMMCCLLCNIYSVSLGFLGFILGDNIL